MKEKVVLAYSGGLDTTAIIPWLKETYGYEVVCCCINCGQGEELDGLEERAKLSGASKLYIEDITDEFCDDYIVPCVQAGAVYEHKYLLGTAMARPGIAKKLVEIARKENAVAICHGATGKGNDQIRFELGIKALAPDIKIIAPWRDDKWQMDSREAEIAYCKAHGIDLPFGTDQSYSRDRNLWHISHEGLELENPANEPFHTMYNGLNTILSKLVYLISFGSAFLSVKEKVLPTLTSLRSVICSPCASTICLTIASPSPVPPCSRDRPLSVR